MRDPFPSSPLDAPVTHLCISRPVWLEFLLVSSDIPLQKERFIMTPMEIGKELVTLCREKKKT